MAKRATRRPTKKTAKNRPAKKRASRQPASAKGKEVFATDQPLPPKQRTKVLNKLRKMATKPSHPSSITGPALELDFVQPLRPHKRKKKSAQKKGKRSGRS